MMAELQADDDPVVRTIDVYLSQTLKDNLYLLQVIPPTDNLYVGRSVAA
jgi:hypothetical protein